MKNLKLSLLSLAACLISGVQAQRFSPIGKEFTDSLVVKHGIYEISVSNKHYHKGKNSYSNDQNLKYDRLGREIQVTNTDLTRKRPRMTSKAVYIYDINGPSLNDYSFIAGNYYYQMSESYNEKNELSSYMYFKRNGKVTQKVMVQKPDSNTVVYLRYHKGYKYSGKTIESRINHKLATYSIYNKKNKLIRTYDYTCNQEGKQINPKKDTIKVCSTRSILRNGDYIVTTTGYYSDGTPYRIVEHFDSLKQNLEYKYFYGKEDFMTTYRKNEYEGRRLISKYEYYGYRKSKDWRSSNILFDKDEKVISRTDSSKWGKKLKVEKFEYSYNSQGLISSRRSYSNGALSSESFFTYRFFRDDKALKTK